MNLIISIFILSMVRLSRNQSITNKTRQDVFNTASLVNFTLEKSLDIFARSSFGALINKNTNPNLIYSPFSLHVAMSMLYYGSPEESQTHIQLAKALGLNRGINSNRQYLLNYLLLLSKYKSESYTKIANGLFTDKSVKLLNDFKNVLSLFYGAEPVQLNMVDGQTASNLINSFVSANTQNQVRELIDPASIDDLTKVILVNALHFQGTWKQEFIKSKTQPGTFNTLRRGPITYPKMMKVSGTFWASLNDSSFSGANIVELPYQNENYTMTIYVAPDSSISSLNKLLKNFVRTELFLKTSSNKLYPLKMNLTMPKFSIESSKDMIEIFKTLGVKDVFDENLANLSDISSNFRNLKVDSVIHKAKIDVNEKGSEASAATAVIAGIRSSQANIPPIPFNVDMPFIFSISDKRFRVPLFIGLVTDLGNGELQRSSKQLKEKRARKSCNLHADEISLKQILFPCK